MTKFDSTRELELLLIARQTYNATKQEKRYKRKRKTKKIEIRDQDILTDFINFKW